MLSDSALNISAACKNLGISRQTYYDWSKDNELFVQEVDDLNEERKDYAETKLDLNIKAGKENSIFFFLSRKAKDRGYGDKQEIVLDAMPSLVELVKECREEEKMKKKDNADNEE